MFNERIDRFNTASVKWERTKEVFGTANLIPMWVADMDFRPPQAVLNAISDRVNHGIFGYTFVPPSTYTAIQEWVKKRHNWNIDTSSLLYCTGVVPSISIAIQSYTEPGDKILLQSPVYTPFFDMIKRNGRTVVNAPLQLNDKRYEIDYNRFEKELMGGCKLFLLCSPHNPSGRVWTKEELLKIGELCIKYNCLILSDEIHSDIVYPKFKHFPIASLSSALSQQTVTCIAPSKTFNLAGLQASAVIIENATLRNQFNETLKRQGFFSLNTFGIIGMEAAYREGEEWLHKLIDYLQDNKDFTVKYIQEHLPKITCIDPEGTYLLWLDCRKLLMKDKDLHKLLIEKGKIALEPGPKYGPGGEGFIRLNFACPREILIEGLERLRISLS